MKSFFRSALSFFSMLLMVLPFTSMAVSLDTALIEQGINNVRKENGLLTLKIDSRLERAALAKAKDIAQREALIHTSGFPWTYLVNENYVYDIAGENLAMNIISVDELIGGWMNSPSHRENILNPDFQDMGVAVVLGSYHGDPSDYIVSYFGKEKIKNAKNTAVQKVLNDATDLNLKVAGANQNSAKILLIQELISLLTRYLALISSQ